MQCSMFRTAVFLCSSAILSACSANGSAPIVPQTPAQPAGRDGPNLTVGSYSGHFTEFTVPGAPHGITVGPDGAVWVTLQTSIARLTGNGNVTNFPAVPGVDAVFGAIASLHGKLWYGVDYVPSAGQEPTQCLAGQPLSGVAELPACFAAFDLPDLIAGPDANLWASFVGAAGSGVMQFPESGVGVDLLFPDLGLTAEDLAAGPDGNIYVTAAFGDAAPDSRVVKISTTGKILDEFPLPAGSAPIGITAGPDGALWIALSAANSIARMTTHGNLTVFPLQTPDSLPIKITKASDGALWFTEENADAIGRITTSGAITQYFIPTQNARPYGITACPLQCENAHGRIWFTESNANKVGKFEF